LKLGGERTFAVGECFLMIAREKGGMTAEKEEKKSILEIRDISIALDTYEDIFSDFDPRPYKERDLSIDFLNAIKMRHVEAKKGQLEVRFFMPSEKRNQKIETTIKRRLRDYFTREMDEMREALNKRRKSGAAYMIIGGMLLLFEGVIAEISLPIPLPKLIEIMLVPAGWFGMWIGIGRLVEKPEGIAEEIGMSEKLSKASFIFLSEEDKEPA
jgi:hypothetical protein